MGILLEQSLQAFKEQFYQAFLKNYKKNSCKNPLRIGISRGFFRENCGGNLVEILATQAKNSRELRQEISRRIAKFIALLRLVFRLVVIRNFAFVKIETF